MMAKETLSHYVPTTVEPVPRPVPPPARPINTDISQAVAPPVDPMTQSWQVVSGFPATPAPPRIPDALANLWLQRPPDNFTALLPPTHPAGQHGLLRSDSPFRLYSQLLNEFTDWIRTSRPDLYHYTLVPGDPSSKHRCDVTPSPMSVTTTGSR